MIEIPALLWQPILRGIILNTRPAKSARAYREVWTKEGSPLAVITAKQAKALAKAFAGRATVDWAMRYGNPGIAGKLDALKAAGCERILLAPLYPQYCSATTATANDAAFAALARMRWQPALRTLPPYYDDPLYIGALKADLERQIEGARLHPRPAAAELSRHAAAHARAWRPLFLPVPQDRAAARGGAWARGRCRLPVAVRARQMARTGDRCGARRLSRPGRAQDRRRGAGIFRRLPRDDRGARAFAAATRS